MTNKETIDRWAEQIIPAVFKAEDALHKAKPEWKERLRRLGEPGGKPPGDSDHHRDARLGLRARRDDIDGRCKMYEG